MITIRFKCACMIGHKAFEMTPRAEGESLDEWMPKMQLELLAAHKAISPKCKRTICEKVKIPLHESNPNVGGAPRIN